MKRILNYIPAYSIGGVESLFLNFVNSINQEKYNIDLLVEKEISNSMKEELKKLNINLIILPEFSVKNSHIYFFKILEVLKKNKYEIIHAHSFIKRPFVVMLGKILGTKKIILHGHMLKIERYEFLSRVSLGIIKFFATDFIACSEEAGKYLFGRKFKIIENGIKLENFRFDKNKRTKIRNQLGISNEILIGQIGRICDTKNQNFSLELYSKILKENSNYRLLYIGEGEDFENFKKKIQILGLFEKVRCLGKQDDIQGYLSALDIYIMPSKYEAFGLGAIEAQISGISGIVSTAVNQRYIFSSNFKRLDLVLKEWEKAILDIRQFNRLINDEQVIKRYSIQNYVKKIEEYYDN